MKSLSVVLCIGIGCADQFAPISLRAEVCSTSADCLVDEACVSRGATKVCLRSAALNRCDRDGILEGLERCDDGNSSNEDGCTNACQLARCGDGFVRRDLSPEDPGFEECEPGVASDWVANCRANCRVGRRHSHLIAHQRTICLLDTLRRGQQRLRCGVNGLSPFSREQPAAYGFDVPISGLLAPSLAMERSGWLLELSPGVLGDCVGNDCRHGITLGLPSRSLRDTVFELDSSTISLSDAVLKSGVVESVISPGFCSSIRQAHFLLPWGDGGRNMPLGSFIAQDYGRLPFGLTRQMISKDELSDVVSIARSHRTACAVHMDGRVSCWGDPAGWGHPGTGNIPTLECEYVAPQVLEGVSDVVELEAEEESFVALRRDGTYYTWGRVPLYGRVQVVDDNDRFRNRIVYNYNECERRNQTPFHHTRYLPVNQVAAAYCTHCILEEGGKVLCKGMFDTSNHWVAASNTDDFVAINNAALFDQQLSRGWVELAMDNAAIELSRGLKESTVLCSLMDNGKVLCWGQNPHPDSRAYYGDQDEPLGTYRSRPPQSVREFMDQ